MEVVNGLDTLPVIVKDVIRYFLYTIKFGNLVINVQDGFVVKTEITEKIFITAKDREKGLKKPSVPAKKHQAETTILDRLSEIQFGQLIVRLENGQVAHIEKTEKFRVDELKGVNGEGI